MGLPPIGGRGDAPAAEVLARVVQGLAGTERSAAHLLDDAGRLAEVRHVHGPQEHMAVIRDRLIGKEVGHVRL